MCAPRGTDDAQLWRTAHSRHNWAYVDRLNPQRAASTGAASLVPLPDCVHTGSTCCRPALRLLDVEQQQQRQGVGQWRAPAKSAPPCSSLNVRPPAPPMSCRPVRALTAVVGRPQSSASLLAHPVVHRYAGMACKRVAAHVNVTATVFAAVFVACRSDARRHVETRRAQKSESFFCSRCNQPATTKLNGYGCLQPHARAGARAAAGDCSCRFSFVLVSVSRLLQLACVLQARH